jgi:hypothetical protein
MPNFKLLFFYPFILISLLFFVFGCVSKVSPPLMVDQGQVQIISHSSTQMATYLKQNKDRLWLCKENISDAIKTSHEGVTLKGVIPKENVSVGDSSGALSLGGMAPEVLITSELLYRACELCANLNADDQLTLKIYKMFLDAIDKTAAAQKETGAKAIYGTPASDSAASSSSESDSSSSSDDTE